MYAPKGVEFAAYIPFYAPCYMTFIGDEDVSDKPIRLFHGAADDSLAESLMKVENGGAVAVWASSGLTQPAEQALMNQQLYRLLFGEGGLALGEAARKAKAAVNDLDIRRTWILLGDPTMRFK